MTGPTYKAREDYRTRRSGEEMDAIELPAQDFAATALDRPVADIADLERAALMQRVEQHRRGSESTARSKRRLWIGMGIALAVGLSFGVAVGAYLALS